MCQHCSIGKLNGDRGPEKVSLSSILRYSETVDLDPFSMTGHGALALLKELVASAVIVSRDGP